MKHISDKQVGVGIVIAIVVQIAIVSILVYGHVYSSPSIFESSPTTPSTNWLKMFLVTVPLIIPSFVASYYIAHYGHLPTLWKKYKVVTLILVGLLLYVLSFLIYLNGATIVG